MMKKRTLFVTLAAVAAGSYAVVQMVSPSETTITPTAEASGPCYYTWAYQELPELSAEFDAQVKALDEHAFAKVQAYGEDCTTENGVSTFSALETNFYVRLPVTNLEDHESFGDWMAMVMQVAEGFPPEALLGPQIGFVQFWFEAHVEDYLVVKVPIIEYREKASGLSGAELFNFFYKSP